MSQSEAPQAADPTKVKGGALPKSVTLTEPQLENMLLDFIPFHRARSEYSDREFYSHDINIPYESIEEAKADMMKRWQPICAQLETLGIRTVPWAQLQLPWAQLDIPRRYRAMVVWLRHDCHLQDPEKEATS
jgi:hypothetical protein